MSAKKISIDSYQTQHSSTAYPNPTIAETGAPSSQAPFPRKTPYILHVPTKHLIFALCPAIPGIERTNTSTPHARQPFAAAHHHRRGHLPRPALYPASSLSGLWHTGILGCWRYSGRHLGGIYRFGRGRHIGLFRLCCLGHRQEEWSLHHI